MGGFLRSFLFVYISQAEFDDSIIKITALPFQSVLYDTDTLMRVLNQCKRILINDKISFFVFVKTCFLPY